MGVLEDSLAELGKKSSNVGKDFRPVHGILSMHGRKKADSWSCLVCGTSQPLTNNACSTCNRGRFPPWLLDVNGCVVLPGSIVSRTDGVVSPPKGVSPRSRTTSTATVPQQSPKAKKTGHGNGASVSGGGGIVSSPRRRVKGRAEADFEAVTTAMRSKFEGQSGDCIFIVVAVNGVRPQPPRAPRSLEGYCIVEGDDELETSRFLVKVVLDMTEATSVKVIDPSLENEEREKFLQFGLCGRCERTYRIGRGWKHALQKKTVAEWEEKLRNLLELAGETEARKGGLIEGRGSCADILRASESLKRIGEEIAATRRLLEPLVTSCPFCLWSCAPLFIAGDAEAAEQRERPDPAGLGEAR
eukprot:g10939.t1